MIDFSPAVPTDPPLTGTGLTEVQMQALTESVTSTVYAAVADALPDESAALMEGEIMIPGGEEMTVIEIVQSLLSYFQEDDNKLLTDLRDRAAKIEESVGVIQKNTAFHPMLETPFEEYSVTEGLLLLLVIWLAVVNPCIRMVKGGFSWLLS